MAGQVTRAVDTDGCSAAEVVPARHGQQATPLVGGGQYGVTDLGEGTVAEDPVDGERDSHSVDLRNIQEIIGTRAMPKASADADTPHVAEH
ncbi:hypothetical protein ACFU6I_21545 [Streptomyces sp. NPDC057486]|uniref:hypothetical protein n=1 Tax=Streptomyces sp. NPDC057486 TaxID=3346145 RepID=UPI0036C3948E